MKFPHIIMLPAITACLLLAKTGLAQPTKNGEEAVSPFTRSFAIKSGANYALMPAQKSFSLSNNFGFFAGACFARPSQSRVGFRTELLLSRQGYDYASNRQTGNVMLTYILFPQLATFRITHFLELQAGGQVALLLKANVDSSANPSSVPDPDKANNYFNRINYGVAAGLEIFPSKGSFIGARYNLFLDLYKKKPSSGYPPFVPDHSGNLKNGLVQLYVGFRF